MLKGSPTLSTIRTPSSYPASCIRYPIGLHPFVTPMFSLRVGRNQQSQPLAYFQ
jgi:hypothetical protein